MPGQRDPRRTQLNNPCTRELFYKVDQEANARGIPRSEYVCEVLEAATRNTVLTPENLRKIRIETDNALKKRGLTYEVIKAADQSKVGRNYSSIRKEMEGTLKRPKKEVRGKVGRPRKKTA